VQRRRHRLPDAHRRPPMSSLPPNARRFTGRRWRGSEGALLVFGSMPGWPRS
jgi:hypothetical protein